MDKRRRGKQTVGKFRGLRAGKSLASLSERETLTIAGRSNSSRWNLFCFDSGGLIGIILPCFKLAARFSTSENYLEGRIVHKHSVC